MRWNIEVDFRAIKATLAMDALRCKSALIIEKEFAAIATLKLPHRPDRIEPRAKKPSDISGAPSSRTRHNSCSEKA